MKDFGVSITNLNSTVFDLTPMLEQVRFTTQLPGGCAEFSGIIAAEFGQQLAIPPYLGYNYRLNIYDGGGIFWSGRTNYPSLQRGQNGYRWTVRAKGYGVTLSDQISSTINARNTQTSTLVANALASLAPDITATEITATGFTISNTADVNLARITPAMAIAWANRFGDASYNPQLATVYPDGDGTIRFVFKPRPTAEDITGSLYESDSAEIGGDESEYANKITIQYNNGASYASASDTVESGRLSLVKEYVSVMPEISQAADATQAANAILAAKKKLRLSPSGPLVYRTNATLRNASNTPIPLHRIRSGQMFKLVDIAPYQDSASNLAFMNSFLIAETTYDEDAQSLTITPESYTLMLQRSVATVYSLIAGRYQIGV